MSDTNESIIRSKRSLHRDVSFEDYHIVPEARLSEKKVEGSGTGSVRQPGPAGGSSTGVGNKSGAGNTTATGNSPAVGNSPAAKNRAEGGNKTGAGDSTGAKSAAESAGAAKAEKKPINYKETPCPAGRLLLLTGIFVLIFNFSFSGMIGSGQNVIEFYQSMIKEQGALSTVPRIILAVMLVFFGPVQMLLFWKISSDLTGLGKVLTYINGFFNFVIFWVAVGIKNNFHPAVIGLGLLPVLFVGFALINALIST